MKRKFLSFILIICLVLSGTFTLTACGKPGRNYTTIYPEQYEIVLRTQRYNTSSEQYEYKQETFICCVEAGQTEPSRYYKLEDYGTDENFTNLVETAIKTNDESTSTPWLIMDMSFYWSELNLAVNLGGYQKYLDSDIINENEYVNGTLCTSYNHNDIHIEKISQDEYHLIWYNEIKHNGHSNITQIYSLKTTSVTIPTVTIQD